MRSDKFKIICYEQEQELSRMIRALFQNMAYELRSVHSGVSLITELKAQETHLLIVNNTQSDFSEGDLRKIQRTNGLLYLVLVEEGEEKESRLLELRDLSVLQANELDVKLPFLLNDIYSRYAGSQTHGLAFWQLLQQTFEQLNGLVILTNSEGIIIYLNRVAKEKLKLGAQNLKGENLRNFLVDGSKSWKFILENCCVSQENEGRFLLKFSDAEQQVFSKNISVSRLIKNKTYWLFQEAFTSDETETDPESEEPQLLEKFAESVANELLNPVNVISGRLQLLKKALDKEFKADKNLEAIEKQIDRTAETVAKLLTFARLKHDFIPQKVQLNEVLKRLKLEPSIFRLLQRTNIKLIYDFSSEPVVLLGQLSHFDLLFKTLLEVSFDCVGSGGGVTAHTAIDRNGVTIRFELRYVDSVLGHTMTLESFLGGFKSDLKRKSIETTIIRQIIQQYRGTYFLDQGNAYTENLNMLFPYSQSFN